MSFNPKDFFIGVVHLFVIFLPGAVLCLTVFFFTGTMDQVKGLGGGLLFAGASFFAGHLVSLIGSGLEDFSSKIWGIGLSEKEGGWALRRLVHEILDRELPHEVVTVKKLRRWSTVLIRQNGVGHQAEVERKDADRRFFRNMRIVIFAPVIALLLSLGTSRAGSEAPLAAAVLVVLALLSHLRYKDQDAKFTRLLFESIVAMYAKTASSRVSTFSHAGGVVFRRVGFERKYLVVQSNEGGEWVLPKGHIEPGETPESAAVREVSEEAGVGAEICAFLGASRYRVGNEEVRIAHYLLEFREETRSEERRETEWHNAKAAVEALEYQESKRIMRQAIKLARARRRRVVSRSEAGDLPPL